MTRAFWLPFLLMAACAHGEGGLATKSPGADQATAKRIYMVAEERFAAGAYDEAVALMRHSLLQLPASPEHDELRHQLLLRMAHTQLQAHTASGQVAPLRDAQQMLTRYVERHEQLFGESEKARAERGEAYELLYEVEKRLEPGATDAAMASVAGDEATEAPEAEAMEAETMEAAALDGAAAATENADAAAANPETAAEADDEPSDRQPAAHTPADGESADGNVREIVVSTKRRRPSIDDPQMVAKLRSAFSDPEAGLVLTRPGVELLHGPRPLVRGTSRLAGPGDLRDHQLARKAGRSLVRDAREDLRGCYEAAFTRETVDALQSTVEASIHPDGSVSQVRIVRGGLIDGYGDACLIEAMQRTTVAPLAEAAEPVRVQLALTFLYESAVYIVEGTGEQLHAGGVMLRPNPVPAPGLPPIEHFAK
jgi:hypothetical protein